MSENILDQGITKGGNQDFYARTEQLISDGYEVRISDYLKRGFELFKKFPGGFIGFMLVNGLISAITNLFPYVGYIISIIISPALVVGWFVVARKIDTDEAFDFGDFFNGFKKTWPLVGAYLLVGLLIIVGSVLLVIPGIYLAIALSFTLYPIYFSNLQITESMEVTRKVITKKWFSFLLFFIVLGLVNILGAIALGIGLFISIPVSILAMYAAYEDIFGFDN